eukprot:749566-Hanusia_phi.AAC.2
MDPRPLVGRCRRGTLKGVLRGVGWVRELDLGNRNQIWGDELGEDGETRGVATGGEGGVLKGKCGGRVVPMVGRVK